MKQRASRGGTGRQRQREHRSDHISKVTWVAPGGILPVVAGSGGLEAVDVGELVGEQEAVPAKYGQRTCELV